MLEHRGGPDHNRSLETIMADHAHSTPVPATLPRIIAAGGPVSRAVEAGRGEEPKPDLDPATMPALYGLILRGTCMEPELPNGCIVAATTTERPRIGDLVIVYLRPHARAGWGHQAIIKRLVLMQRPGTTSNIAPCIVVEQINPRRNFTFLWDDVEAVHKCLGEAEAGTTRQATTTEKKRSRRTLARAAAGMR